MEEKVGAQERRDMVALALLCRDGTDGSAAAGLRRGGGVLDGMVSLCSRTGCRYMRNPAYGSAVAGTAERARAETLSGTSEACLSALPSETKKPLKTAAFHYWCPGRDSNSHAVNRHYPLKVACLPIPPPGLLPSLNAPAPIMLMNLFPRKGVQI